MKIKLLLFILLLTNQAFSQSYKYAHYCLDSLISKDFGGRGYQDDGDKKSANFIERELVKNGIKPIKNNSYKQNFELSINNIEKCQLKLHSKDSSYLILGKDYILYGSSPTTNLILENEKPVFISLNDKKLEKNKEKLNNKTIVFDLSTQDKGKVSAFIRTLSKENIVPKLVIIQNSSKMQYLMGRNVSKFPVIELRDALKGKKIKFLELSIKANYVENYQSQNVWGFVEGKKHKDSLFVFTAHYDHLGKIGDDCYFPGANDNASGVAVLLDLAKYYAENPSDYSIAFIFVSAEEIGLLGSTYAASNPMIELSNVKFLFNLDMCGTGSGGIALINGKKEIKASEHMLSINSDKRYFNEIRVGGESCNSDHCPFVMKGVPAFFIFTFGCEYNEYHTIQDNGNNLSFTKYLDLCNILKDFISTYNK
ncbi:MAG: DUF4910 domain-containing protein [Bacteroidales bacterium]